MTGNTSTNRLSLTVVILTYNEERHIVRAMESVRSIASDTIVVDSVSSDRTVALAEAAGARVLSNGFVNQARQFQWAMDHAGITTDWVLRLDADEVIEPDLQARIAEKLPMLPTDVSGVTFSRKHIFMGRWVRHGGRYPLIMLRLFRTGRGRIEDRWMDEHIVVDVGRVVHFDGGFADVNLHNVGYFIDKHNRYATREAVDVLGKRFGLLGEGQTFAAGLTSRQATFRRWAKECVYNRLPLGVGPLVLFLYRYIAQLGFLDGATGLIYHVLQGFWYRFLVDAKILEFEQALVGSRSNADRVMTLSHLSGLDLAPERVSVPSTAVVKRI